MSSSPSTCQDSSKLHTTLCPVSKRLYRGSAVVGRVLLQQRGDCKRAERQSPDLLFSMVSATLCYRPQASPCCCLYTSRACTCIGRPSRTKDQDIFKANGLDTRALCFKMSVTSKIKYRSHWKLGLGTSQNQAGMQNIDWQNRGL